MNTKEKILSTMYNLIAEKGYDASSIGQICEIVGISKPAVYYYFKSKEEIFIELFQNTIDGTNEVFSKEKLASIETVEAYYDFLIEAYKVYAQSYVLDKQSHLVTIEFSIQSNRIPVIRKMQNELIVKVINDLKEVLKKGISIRAFNQEVDVNKQADFLYTTLLGCDTSIMYGMPIDTESVWKIAIDCLFNIS